MSSQNTKPCSLTSPLSPTGCPPPVDAQVRSMTTNLERRPSSAIFVGINVSDLDQSSFSTPPPKDVDLPSGLPSPPQTISASGSNGDNNSSNSGSIRGISKPTEPPRETMYNGGSHLNHSTSSRASDADDGLDDEGEHTARLSDDRQLEGATAPLKERVQSLADRNRQVLDKLASITSSMRGTPTSGVSTLRTQTPSSHDSLTRNSSISRRLSFSRSAADPNENYPYGQDERSTTPPATARKVSHISPRQRLVSEPTSPHKLRLNSATSGSISSINNMSSRRNLQQIFEPPSEDDGSFRNSPTLARRTRQPLPREFLNEAFYRGDKSNTSAYASSEASSAAPTTSSGSLAPRPASRGGSLSPGLSSNSLQRSPRSSSSAEQSFARRSATVREVRTSSHRAWQSADLNSPDTETESGQRRTLARYESRGGSAESPLAVRSVVGESLKAAGLTRRRDTDSPTNESFQPRRRIPSGNFNTPSPLAHERRESMRNDWEYSDEQRLGPRRSDAGTPFRSLDHGSTQPYTPQTYATERLARQTPNMSGSRPSTTMAAYDDERALSRQGRPSTGLERKISLGTTPTPKTFMSPSGITRTLPAKNSSHHASPSTGSTITEHAHLMQDALHMFESHCQKLPRSNALPNLHDDVIRDARVIVAAAGSLNKALRAAVGVAMDEQVEAEVADEADEQTGQIADIWGRVGAEFREDVRVSDELVRTMTSFMIGVGRMLRTVTAANPPVDGRRSNEGRRSVELSGRRSTEARSSMDYREDGLRRLTPNRPMGDAMSNGSGSAGFPERERDIVSRLAYGGNEGRPSSVLSMIRDHDRQGAMDTPTFTHLSSHRQKGRDLPSLPLPPVSAKQLSFPQSADGGDRTPLEAPRKAVRHSTLPPLAVPPPLATLPSESLIRSKSTKLAPKRSRVASNATVRGAVILPSPASTSVEPVITPTTASSEERSNNNNNSTKTGAFSFTRTKGSNALRGLQQVASSTLSLNRRRSISTAVEGDEIASPAMSSPGAPSAFKPAPLRRASSSLTTTPARVLRSPPSSTLSAGSSNGKLSDGAKKIRAARVRMSLDSSVTPIDDDLMDSPSQNATQRTSRRLTDTYS